MQHIKETSKMIRYNIKTLVGFELFFKILTILLFTPLFVHLFDFIMKFRGFSYLTLENLLSFLFHPLTLILLLILILLMMIYTMFDITTIILILDYSHHKQKISIINAIRISLEKCKTMPRMRNFDLALLVLFLIPFFNIGISSSFISKITLPEFIQNYMQKDFFLVILSILVISCSIILILRFLYAIHYYVLENVSWKEAKKKSCILGYKNHVKDWFILIVVQLVLFLFYILFIGVGILLIMLMQHFLGNLFLKSILTTVIFGFIAISFLFFTLLSTPISYATISSLYYIRKEKRKEKAINIAITINPKNKQTNKILKGVFIGITILAISIGTAFTYGLYKGKYDLNIEYTRLIEITAHRGASALYPENTFAAFIGAEELGADIIELDVQQTKDKKIIVMHDKNLKRTTGVDKQVWETTYEEIQNLDVGSFFNSEFKEEKIPLLQDVVAWAKEKNIKLNIELKPTGKETDFIETVIAILKEADYIENIVIASQTYQVLENVKRIEERIKTVYVASLFYGDIHAFPCADDFSLEASVITSSLVSNIHENGKEIYAWTINTEENMNKMIELNVDNIITDNIELAKKMIILKRKSNLIYEYIKWIEKHF